MTEKTGRYILIHMPKLRVVKVAPTLRQAEYWAELLCKNVDFRVQGPENRYWSRFSMMELGMIHMNAGGPSGKWADYAQALRETAAAVERIGVDHTPEEELERRLGRVLPLTREDSPIAQALAGAMVGAQRDDCMSNHQTEDLSAGARSRKVAPTAPPQDQTVKGDVKMAAAKKAASKKSPPKKAASKAAPAKKAAPKKSIEGATDKVVQNGVPRPRAGTSSEKIWSTADDISRKEKRPAQRSEVMEALADSGIPATSVTAGFQHWRKFNGLSGRE